MTSPPFEPGKDDSDDRLIYSADDLVRQGVAPPPEPLDPEQVRLQLGGNASPPEDGRINWSAGDDQADWPALFSPGRGNDPNETVTDKILSAASSRESYGYLVSVVFHLFVFIFLAVFVFQKELRTQLGEPLAAGFSDDDAAELVDSIGEMNFDDTVSAMTVPEILPEENFAASDPTMIDLENLIEPNVPLPEEVSAGEQALIRGDAEKSGGPVVLQGITSGRSSEGRKRGLPGHEGDTTETSELAVEAGLAWLARHQLPDGGWAFDLNASDDNFQKGECQGQCTNSAATAGGMGYRGQLHPSRMAATGMALLPFLGAGYTHRNENQYQENIRSGLEYLRYRSRQTEYGIDLRAGANSQGMYVQAIAALTLCEAYEMTHDEELRPYAEGAIRFIIASQFNDGGWRYTSVGDQGHAPEYSSGDTSVTGWVMLAIKSGISAGFTIEPQVYYQVSAFLDMCASDGGALYRYMPQSGENESALWGTTAASLLVREYLGWTPSDRRLKRGMNHLGIWFSEINDDWNAVKKNRAQRDDRILISDDGRFVCNLYFAYYGALAMFQVGGRAWKKAFVPLREFLIATQSRGEQGRPHESGSWLFYDRYLNDGGRLLNTALSVLILETPYRYLPMYGKK